MSSDEDKQKGVYEKIVSGIAAAEEVFDYLANVPKCQIRIHELHRGPPAGGISWVCEPRHSSRL